MARAFDPSGLFERKATERLGGSSKRMKRGFVKATITKASAQDVADSFRSNVQLLPPKGWT